jgi:aspartate kinase
MHSRDKSPLVMKFGGAALKNLRQITKIAEIIAIKKKEYPQIVVVVSAMGKMTDELFSLAKKISSSPPKREQDMLVSVGERVSMALLAIALKEKGQNAVSLTGSQSGIITSDHHTEATIQDIRPSRILEGLNQEKIVIVAGFQGMSANREITTLGRGGSDTTAVALGIALNAVKVEFYKDVAGVYSDDPRMSRSAYFLSKLSYDEALRIAQKGYFVLHLRAILLGSRYGIPLHILTFKQKKDGENLSGTLITAKNSPYRRRGEKGYETT